MAKTDDPRNAENAPTSKVSISEIRQNVALDKDLGMQAVRKAGHELKNFQTLMFSTDITGRPDLNKQYHAGKRDQYRGLEAACRKPFYRRIRTRVDYGGEVEDLIVLISEARGTGGVVAGDGWLLVSFSSTTGTQLEGKKPGDTVRIKVPKRSGVSYDVGESTRYEVLLPQFENGEFQLLTGEAAFASEAALDAEEHPKASLTALPAREYEAKATFGLNDIIVLRDDPQIAAMALPFGASVIIEGPPGSGKTSVGIMRLAAMYDRQWDELGLDPAKDLAFHDYSTMRVLVYNPEMVEYLKTLSLSIGVQQVQFNTTYDYFRHVCRKTRLLTGTPRKDRPSLAIMKGRRESLRAFFAGFKAHAVRTWESRGDDLRRALFALAPDFLVLADRIEAWTKWVKQARLDDDKIVGSIGLADVLTDAASDIANERSATRKATNWQGGAGDRFANALDGDSLKRKLIDAKRLVLSFIEEACSRAGSVSAMFDLAEYFELKASMEAAGVPSKTIADADRLWRRQYKGTLPAYSEFDLAMSAWLGARLLLTSRARSKPWIGGQLDRVTHFVVDEVQDLSPSHLTVLASQLVEGGTMTLVGDIHQNLNPHAGLRRWDEVGLAGVQRTAFGVNHRQTVQLGGFLKYVHTGLFGEACPWEPSPKLTGALPRAGIARSWKELAKAVAQEAKRWRTTISGETGATVAVLYDGQLLPKRLAMLKKRVAAALQDDLVSVEIASKRSGGEILRRTDQVVIASVRQTKGLEFDAVIYIEPKPRWFRPAGEIDLRVRNGFYVATSRARAGLSLCMSNLPSCVGDAIAEGLCESANWDVEPEGDV